MSPKNVLICFMSCYKNKDQWKKLDKLDINKIIFYGDPTIDSEFEFNGNILKIKCPDTYDYLPVKVYRMIGIILQMQRFKDISHILKVDDHDTIVNDQIHRHIEKLNLSDYNGQRINKNSINRQYHFGKCPEDSSWNSREYSGEFCDWCDGGCSYILSRKAMRCIASTNLSASEIYKNIIYEDLMVALILKAFLIFPNKIDNIVIGDK